MKTPRDYQVFAADAVVDYFGEKTGNPIVAMPTGTGKALVIAELVRRALRDYGPGQRLLVLTHVKELIRQNYEELLEYWPTAPAGVYSAGLSRRDASQAVTFAGIGSVAKKAPLFGHIDLVIVDECHLISPKEGTGYRRFIAALTATNPALKVVGLTATPFRLGSGYITDDGLFTDVCCDMTGLEAFNWFIDQGYLSPLVTKRTKAQLDVSEVRTTAGDFNNADLQAAVDVADVTRAAVAEMVEQGADRKHWLIFAAGIEHGEHISAELSRCGIVSAVVHSQLTDPSLRDSLISDFKAGKIRALVNNNILTTGFNFPGIDLIGYLRPTKSVSLWVQSLGRGTRMSPDKTDCLVLDFSGNTARLGPINDPVVKVKGKGTGTAPVRLCEFCDTYNHAAARVCVCCGNPFPRETKIQATASETAVVAEAATEPEVVVYRVDRVEYHRHVKQGAPQSVRVVYWSGLRWFNEWVCIEHAGFASRKAREWWRARSAEEPPTTTEAVLESAEALAVPSHIRVWCNRRPHPQIMAYDFTGQAFGETPAPEDDEVPF